MKSISIIIVLLVSFCVNGIGQDNVTVLTKKQLGRIVIEVEFPPKVDAYYKHIEFAPRDFEMLPEWDSLDPILDGNMARWTLISDAPLVVNMDFFMGNGNMGHYYEPGDSIHIDYRKKIPVYSGVNAGKFQALEEIKAQVRQLQLPENNSFSNAQSLADYEQWNDYLDKRQAITASVLQEYRSKMSPGACDYLKGQQVGEIEYERLRKFGSLEVYWLYNKMPVEQLCRIFDSLAANEYGRWLRNQEGKIEIAAYYYDFVRRSVFRQFNFDHENDTLKGVYRKVLYADLAKRIYKDATLQEFLVFLLTVSGLNEHTLKDGYVPEIEKLLTDFYAMPGYAGYKSYVKDYEEKVRVSVVMAGHRAPDFSLEDSKGQLVRKSEFAGKVILINFSIADNKESTLMNNALSQTLAVFKSDSNVVLISVTPDPITAPLNVSGVQAGPRHIVLKANDIVEKMYSVFEYPKVFLVDDAGDLIYHGFKSTWDSVHNFPDPRKDEGKALVAAIKKQLAILTDGPYILHDKATVKIYNIESTSVNVEKKSRIEGYRQLVSTDNVDLKFPVVIKGNYFVEPSTYKYPERLFVFSDIEGNFDSFRKLLMSNKVIDEKYNWTFGKGHLIFAGDMFDRGRQVTECLWLIYSLEDKAKSAGGYVHFILGNHEIMNLNGNMKYVDGKYKRNAQRLGVGYAKLYSEDSELGKWLRTKNIVEKVGNLLFAHGGISRQMNHLAPSIDQINSAARAYYAQDSLAGKSSDSLVAAIFDSHDSPFWYRSYYDTRKTRKTPETVLDSTLQKFDVSRVVTGHTIVADEVSVHFDGRVINTDTRHAKGLSSALLIEGGNYYRVNDKGDRVLLFVDDKWKKLL